MLPSIALILTLLTGTGVPVRTALAEIPDPAPGEALLARGQFPQARELARQVLEREGKDLPGPVARAWRWIEARALHGEGDLEGARDAWAHLVRSPDGERDFSAGLSLARTNLEMWNLPAAREVLEDLEGAPPAVEAARRELLALALALEGKQLEARRDLGALRAPGFTAWHNLGRLEFERGDNRAALRALGQAASLDPRDYYNRLYLAWTHLRLDEREKAREILEGLAKTDPTPEVFQLRARLELRAGDYPGAIRFAREATRGDPTLSGAHFTLATALRRQGEAEAARSALKTFRRLHESERRGLEEAYRLNQLHQSQPDDPKRALDLARHHLEHGDVASAERLAWVILHRSPGNAEARLVLARAYRKLRRFPPALVHYRRAILAGAGETSQKAREELQDMIQRHARPDPPGAR